MNWIKSIVERNPLINLDNIVSVFVTDETHMETCSITFDDKLWMGYQNRAEFEKDLEVIKARMLLSGMNFE